MKCTCFSRVRVLAYMTLGLSLSLGAFTRYVSPNKCVYFQGQTLRSPSDHITHNYNSTILPSAFPSIVAGSLIPGFEVNRPDVYVIPDDTSTHCTIQVPPLVPKSTISATVPAYNFS